MTSSSETAMRVRLSDEGRERLKLAVGAFFRDVLDHDLSEFQAERLIAFFVRELGAPVYNQAIQDARAFVQDKLEDLEGEFYEPERS